MDLSRLSPDDAAVTLRSLPRRFRALLTPAEPEDEGAAPDPNELAHRPGGAGWSAADHVVHVTNRVQALGGALREVLVTDAPPFDEDVLADDAHDGSGAASDVTISRALADLESTTTALASAVQRVGAHDWGRSGTVTASGATITALDIVRAAVDVGVTHLRDAERVVDEVRHQRP